MSLQLAAQHLASKGRGPDTQLVHMAPQEVAGLQALARAHGGSLTVNPETGLAEAGFLKSILPAVIGAGLTAATGGAAAPWMIGLGLGGLETLRTGNLGKGLMAGLGAYGGAGLAGGLAAAGGAGAPTIGAEAAGSYSTAAPATPQAAGFKEGLAQMGRGAANLGTEAGRSAALGGMGGGMQAARYGMGAAAPLLMQTTEMPAVPNAPNPYNFAFDWERGDDPYFGSSKEQVQMRGRLRRLAAGGPVGEMSERNTALTIMSNGGQLFAEGGETKDPARGMSGASAEAMRYLMGLADVSPGTRATRNVGTPAQGGIAALAPARGVDAGSSGQGAPYNFNFDPRTGTLTNAALVQPGVAAPAGYGYSGTGDLGGDRGSSAWDGMSAADQAAFYGANPGMAAATQAAQAAWGATLAGRAQAAFDPQGVARAGMIARGQDPGGFYGLSAQDQAAISAAMADYAESGAAGVGGGGLAGQGASGDTGSDGIGFAYGGLSALAHGGASHLGDYSDGGRLLKGPGDGVSDSIPATIANKRPARLADGEFVVPARIVSELGNGSTEAGARKLYAMMDRIQKNRAKTVGKNKVAVDSRSEKLLPA